jgi:phosphatidate cytidylyltransferase
MKRVATAVVLIPLVLLAILRAPIPLLAAIVGAVALLTTREFLDLAEKYNAPPASAGQPRHLPTYIYIAVLFAFLGVALHGSELLASAGIVLVGMLTMAAAVPFVLLACAMTHKELQTALPVAAAGAVAFSYIALPLALLIQVREMWAGAFLLLFLLVVVWAGDTFAYYTGRAIGRHKMAPRISPGKTWEGAAASFVGAIAIGTLVMRHAAEISTWLLHAHLILPSQGYFALHPPPLWPAALLSAAINIAAQLGDLVESLIKRGAGAKDSGSILPGHGGMLDRIDALLFAAPVLWCYVAWQAIS